MADNQSTDWVAWVGAVTGVLSLGWSTWRHFGDRRRDAQNRVAIETKYFRKMDPQKPSLFVTMRFRIEIPAEQAIARVWLSPKEAGRIWAITAFDAEGTSRVTPVPGAESAVFHMTAQHGVTPPNLIGGFVIADAAPWDAPVGFKFEIRDAGSQKTLLKGSRIARALF